MGDRSNYQPVFEPGGYEKHIEAFLTDAFKQIDERGSLADTYAEARHAVMWIPHLDCGNDIVEKWRDAIDRVRAYATLKSPEPYGEYILRLQTLSDIFNDCLLRRVSLGESYAHAATRAEGWLKGRSRKEVRMALSKYREPPQC